MTIFANDPTIDGLLDGSSWSAQPGVGTTITYSFKGGVLSSFFGAILTDRSHPNDHINDIFKFTVQFEISYNLIQDDFYVKQIKEILDDITSFTQLKFVEDDNNPQLLFTYEINSSIDGTGIHNFDKDSNRITKGIVVLVLESDDRCHLFNKGLIKHELAHVLGLKHPHDYILSDGTIIGTQLPYELDRIENTIMSHNGRFIEYKEGKVVELIHSEEEEPSLIIPEDYMPLDVKALQFLYGAA